jgi:hypothetical protein
MPRRLVGIAIAVVTLVGSAVAYLAWTRTPSYALHEASTAIREHDLAAFQRFVDTEKLAGRFVDDELVSATDQTSKNEFGALAAGIFMMMRPQLVKAAQEALERAVETGTFDAGKAQQKNPAETANAYWKPSSAKVSGYRKIAYVKKQGKIAIAGLEIYDADVDKVFVLDLKLRDLGDHWQVTETANVRQFQESLQEATKHQLDVFNEPIARRLNETVKFEAVKGFASTGQWGFDRKSNVTVRIRNTSMKTISEAHFMITFTLGGEIIGAFRCSVNTSLVPGQEWSGTWSKDANQFISEDMKLYNGLALAQIFPELRSVTFSDGTALQIRSSLPSVDAKPSRTDG